GEASPPRHGTALVAGGDRRVAGALRERDPRAPPLRPAEQVLASGYSRDSRRWSWRQTSGESARPELVGPNLGTITGPSPGSTTTTSVPNVSLSSSARNTSVGGPLASTLPSESSTNRSQLLAARFRSCSTASTPMTSCACRRA